MHNVGEAESKNVAKRRRGTTKSSTDRRLREKRGQGEGASYKPYLYIQDVPSVGLATRVKGWKTGRVHHFLSLLELHYFYLLEWSPVVDDIREQYPLHLAETLAIAKQLGVRHPTDPRTREPTTMTSDFVVTTRSGIKSIVQVRTTKYAKDLAKRRVIEKFEIERVYWGIRNVDWGMVTEQDVNRVVVDNVKWFHPYGHRDMVAPLTNELIARVESILKPRVIEEDVPLTELTNACDDQLGVAPGVSLMVVRHLLASRKWQVDMRQRMNPSRRMVLKAVCNAS